MTRRLVIPAAACIALVFELAKTWAGNATLALIDPDSYMRVVRIRDGLRAGWFTHLVAADNGGHGTIVYWSHLLDAVILAIRAPLLLVCDGRTALYVASLTTGPLFAAAMAAALVWACAPIFVHLPRAGFVWAAPVAALCSPALATYGMAGYVHYHLPLVVLALLAAGCAGRAASGDAKAGLWCGIWAALGVWLSPEILPYVLMSIGAIALSWCLRPSVTGRAWRACGSAFAAGLVLAVIVDPPFGGWMAAEIDRVSVVFAVLGLLVCASAWASVPLSRHAQSTALRTGAYAAIGAAVLASWLLLFPAIARGLASLVPAADMVPYFGVIAEMQPVGRGAQGAGLLATCVVGILSAAILGWRRRAPLWIYAAGCGLVVLVLGAQHVRFVGYAEAFGAAMLPAALELVASLRLQRQHRSLLFGAVAMAFLAPSLLLGRMQARASQEDRAAAGLGCSVGDIAPLLAREGGAIVLTQVSDTPEILWRAPVATVGSLYHRSIGAFIRARAAWRTGPQASVPDAVLATGATHILACDTLGRPKLVADLPPVTLQDRLTRHDVPRWLQETGQAGGYRLYRIDRSAGADFSR